MAEPPNHVVSQRMSGDVSMVGGILAEDKVFLELARRYSHEKLDSVDLLAIDCVGEFLNVMTGLFAVELGNVCSIRLVFDPARQNNAQAYHFYGFRP